MQATIQQQYVVTFKSHSHVEKARLRMPCLEQRSFDKLNDRIRPLFGVDLLF